MVLSDDVCVVGLTGAIGSGCSTAARHLLAHEGYRVYKLASFIEEPGADGPSGNRPKFRQKLQAVGDRMRLAYGQAVLVDLALQAAESSPDVISRLVFDGIRNTGEVHALRRRFGFRFWLVGLLADRETRWDRSGRSYIDDGLGEVAFHEDDERDHGEAGDYGQQVARCVNMADAILGNGPEVTQKAFRTKLLELSTKLNAKEPPAPEPAEVHMQMAFAASHLSQCLKRHVGAVVVDVNGEQVCTGYNENPPRLNPCQREPLFDFSCHRDMVRRERFAELMAQGVHCPICGNEIAERTDSDEVEDVKLGPRWRCPSCQSQARETDLGAYFFPDRAMSWCTAIHAEDRALRNAGERARGGTVFSTTLPCFQCAEKLILAGIEKVVYVEAYPDARVQQQLKLGGIELTQFEGVLSPAFSRLFADARPGAPGVLATT